MKLDGTGHLLTERALLEEVPEMLPQHKDLSTPGHRAQNLPQIRVSGQVLVVLATRAAEEGGSLELTMLSVGSMDNRGRPSFTQKI